MNEHKTPRFEDGDHLACQLIGAAMDAIVAIDDDRRIVVINPAAEKMFGCGAKGAIGDFLDTLIPGDFPLAAGHELRRAKAIRSDGEEFLIETSVAKVKGASEQYVYALIMRDVSERERVIATLSQKESELSEAQRVSHVGSWGWDLITDTLSWSDELFRIFGLEPTAAAPSYAELQADFIHKEDQKFVDDSLNHSFATGEPFDFVYRLKRPDGEVRYLRARGEAVIDETGKPIKFFGTALDITERKRAEDAVTETVERYRLLFANNPMPMWVYDRESLRFLEVNEAALRLYGYTREEFLSMTILEIRPEEERFRLTKHLAELPTAFSNAVWTHQKKDGSLISVEVAADSIEFNGVPARLVLANDITERRSLETQLHQSQKMEAIGMLAGGIAHDFNNLLTAINGYSELLQHSIPSSNPLRSHVDEICKAGKRAAMLTSQLLAFGRKQVLQPKVLSLNDIVIDMERMLRRLIAENIGLKTVLADGLGTTKADPGQIEQALMNLVVNARDAMPDGGRLTIETKNVYLDKEYARTHVSVKPGNYVMIGVSDTGIGMDAATRERIFEPFFSTKEVGRGTGLGLSTTYGIVKQTGGNIWVYSEVGKGTTFKIYFPRAEEDIPEFVPRPERMFDQHGTETVLLAEDEEIVRKLAFQVLEMHGYRVLAAESGNEALDISERFDESIDLLITDVVMPGMSGAELAARIKESRPAIKTLFMSGYTDNAIMQHGDIDEAANFIQKPFSTDDLARKLREILDRAE